MAEDHASFDIVARQTALGHLASGIGHHVINAFSAIVSNAEILRLSTQANQPIDAETIADVIVRTSMDASNVARRLIDFTRPLTIPGCDQVRLDRLVAAVIKTFREGCPPTIHWDVDLAPIPEVSGAEQHLHAMLLLLLTNAREALPNGSGTIGVTTSVDACGWVVLEVRDDGEGMPSEVLERAVEPFFSTKPGHPGIGLSVANGIWRRHRGTLAIQSQPDQGTSVRLCIHPGPVEPA